MEDKNTFSLTKKIELQYNKAELVPQIGDEMTFCKDEETALASYMRYRDEERDALYEPLEEEVLTDLFKKELIEGALSNPIYISGKKFGFFGCRVNLGNLGNNKLFLGQFFLYEME